MSTARRALWVTALLVTLAGLFGMHGLDNHGVSGIESMTHGAGAGPASDTVAHGDVDMSRLAPATLSAAHATSIGLGQHGMDVGAAGMCMAILALALLALLRWLRISQATRVLCAVPRPGRAPACRGRDPDPLCLINLSIQRC
jgi:hypothetical protein